MATFENCEIFLPTISHMCGTIKPYWGAAINGIENKKCKIIQYLQAQNFAIYSLLARLKVNERKKNENE